MWTVHHPWVSKTHPMSNFIWFPLETMGGVRDFTNLRFDLDRSPTVFTQGIFTPPPEISRGIRRGMDKARDEPTTRYSFVGGIHKTSLCTTPGDDAEFSSFFLLERFNTHIAENVMSILGQSSTISAHIAIPPSPSHHRSPR